VIIYILGAGLEKDPFRTLYNIKVLFQESSIVIEAKISDICSPAGMLAGTSFEASAWV
jgi:hypothetical protein